MKVCILLPDDPLVRTNSTITFSTKLAEFLSRLKDEVYILAKTRSRKKLNKLWNLRGFKIFYSKTPYSINIIDEIQRVCPDIVLSLGASFDLPALFLTKKMKMYHIPFLQVSPGISMAGYLWYRTRSSSKRDSLLSLWKGVSGTLFQYLSGKCVFDKHIALSSFHAEEMTRIVRIPRNMIQVIPHGVDIDLFSPDKFDEDLRLCFENKKLVLYVGGLYTMKGVEFLIKAIRQIRDNKFNLHLLIAGSGPEEFFLKRLVKSLSLDSDVTFLGQVPHMELPKFYATCDIFVFPSQRDSFGLPVLEAMASGVPVLTTSFVGASETIIPHKTGWVISTLEADALARSIIQGINMVSDFPAIKSKCRKRVKKKFTWKHTAQKYHDLFESLMSEI